MINLFFIFKKYYIKYIKITVFVLILVKVRERLKKKMKKVIYESSHYAYLNTMLNNEL